MVIGRLISIEVLWESFHSNTPIKVSSRLCSSFSYIIFLVILPCHPSSPSFLIVTFMFYPWIGQSFADLLSGGLDSSSSSLYYRANRLILMACLCHLVKAPANTDDLLKDRYLSLLHHRATAG